MYCIQLVPVLVVFSSVKTCKLILCFTEPVVADAEKK